jgi:hypothetical protein
MPEHGEHRLAPDEHLLRAIGRHGQPEHGVDPRELWMLRAHARPGSAFERCKLQRIPAVRTLVPQDELDTPGTEPALSVVQ